jgi:hypothetical protein
MKRLVILLGVLVLAASSVAYLVVRDGSPEAPRAGHTVGPPSPTADATPAVNKTRFGVMLSTKLFEIRERIDMAEHLGVGYLRPSAVFVESWDGRCLECPVVRDAGLQFVLTIRNGAHVTEPARPPDDLDAYGQAIREILRSYRPALVVIENEENTQNFYAGSAGEYGAQLRAACDVAHDLHTPCTNGGLLSGSVALLVYQHYVDTGQTDRAADFARRAFERWQMNRLQSPGGPQWIAARVREVGEFLAVYGPAGADFVNFHWYVADPQALGEAVDYLQEVTGLPAVTNEIGQRDTDPGTTTGVLAGVRDLGLRYAVWFAIDATVARGLVDPDGTLRQTGVAFSKFLRDNPSP